MPRHCPCCCTDCDRGYIRDGFYDPDLDQDVLVDRLCPHRKPGARLCTRCRWAGCDPVLGSVCGRR